MSFTVPTFRHWSVAISPATGVILNQADIENGIQTAITNGWIPAPNKFEYQLVDCYFTETGVNGVPRYHFIVKRQVA